MLLSPLLTLVRERGGSVWAAGILHGAINAVAGLTLLALSDPAFPWNGIVGIGGYAALALSVLAVALFQGTQAKTTQGQA
jgi:membrane protease YdiL (CAAX protease family)